MPTPPLPELLKAAKQIVRKAEKDGVLGTLTPRLIRLEIEKQFELETGTLNASEYKGPLKDAVTDALAGSGDEGEPTPKKKESKRAKGGAKAKSSEKPTNNKKRKSSAVVVSDEEEAEVKAPSSPAPKSEKPNKKKRKSSAVVVSDEEEAEVQEPSSPALKSEKPNKKKRKSNAVVVSDEEEAEVKAPSSPAPKSEKPNKKKLKSSAVVVSDEEETEERAPESKSKQTSSEAPVKEAKAKRKPKRKSDTVAEESSSAGKKKQRLKKDNKEYKTPEHVPTSDMEDDEPDDPAESSKFKPVELKSKPTSPPSKRRKVSLPPSSDEDEDGERKEDIKADVKREDPSDKSDSEIVDEPPKKKRKVKSDGTKEPKKPTKKAKSTKENKGSGSTKDEETIKRLKSLVLACGVRKPWAKLFADLSESQQIKKLKEILADLGMKGRMSMEQAKAIKEKRELAQELEDVQEFEKKTIELSSKRGRNQGQKPSGKLLKRDRDDEEDPDSEQGDDSDSDEDVKPEKRRSTARKSIMAFLEDQSDEDD